MTDFHRDQSVSRHNQQRMQLGLGIGLIAGATFYRPLVFWARNAWDLRDPLDVFATSAVGFGIGLLLYLGARQLPVRDLPIAFFIAGGAFISFNYHNISVFPAWTWLALVSIASVLIHRAITDWMLVRVVSVLLVVTVGTPALQVALQHHSQRIPYPLSDLGAPPAFAEPTGRVEDILVLVVDSYPMIAVASNWFGHDSAPLERSLKEADFLIPRVSWSHNTFTSLAVPSLLQLDQVIDGAMKREGGNRRPAYEIVGGNNVVAKTLQKAGFEYNHIESGWNGAKCQEVDVCHESIWLDEANWALLAPSLFSHFLEERYGSMSVVNTMRSVDHLRGLEVFDNGSHDYVFAHIMLPHGPYVVDSGCNVVAPDDRSTPRSDYEPIRRQLACVDSLLTSIVANVTDRTAVLITGDHGTGEGGQVGNRPSTWSEADIAERLGALLAYKLPQDCAGPERRTNVYALRAILDCAVDADLPSDAVPFLIGEYEPIEIDVERLASIGKLIKDQRLARD